MDFAKLAAERYSLRQFDNREVEPEKLAAVLAAGRAAPTACNNQPQRILVVRGGEAMERLAACTPCTFGAPLALVVCCDESAAWVRPFDGDNSGVVDAAIVASHLMLQAAELGLGTTWVGYFDPAALAARFRLPAHYRPVAVLPLGYPAAGAEADPLHSQRLPLDQTVFYDSF